MKQDIKQTKSRLNIFQSLRGKLIFAFLIVSLIPLLLVGWFTLNRARAELRNEASQKLAAVRNLKADQVEHYFDEIERDISLVSQLDIVNDAHRGLSSAITRLGLKEARQLGFLGHPELAEAKIPNSYTINHTKYHDLFSNIVKARHYEDVMLVNRTGDIVYTYAKQDDFATNLLDGPYSNTVLAELYQQLDREAEIGDILITDFVMYSPAGEMPVNFVGTILNDEKHNIRGILIYKIPIDLFDELMAENIGLGETGKTYMVNEGKQLLSQEGFLNGLTIDTLAVENGLNDLSDVEPVEINGDTVLSAYQPLNIGAQKWVLLAEQSEAEAIEAASDLRTVIFGVLAVTAVVVIFVGLFFSLRIANPISRLTDIAHRVTGGDLEVRASIENQDETGELAQAFNTMTARLQNLIGSLEEQVYERTAELAMSLEAGQRATAIRNLEELLPTITEFIYDKFELLHAQVFLVDDLNQNLVLRAATGEAGQRLLAHNFSLPIDEDSVVGRAVVEGHYIVVSDTTIGNIDTSRNLPATWYATLLKEEQARKPDSLVPEALSELAIPLIVEGHVIGVLDLQDNKVNRFTRDALNVYEAMAVQFAIAIDSARQWALTQEAQARAEKALQQLTREVWAEKLSTAKQTPGFMYDLSRINALLPDTFSLAAAPNAFSVPLKVQEQVIGYLSVNTPNNRPLTDDEWALLEAVAQQLAQKAENLRLFEATQQRATREQVARRIIDKVRASRNIEMALRIATEELNHVLGTSRAVIDLKLPETEHADSLLAEEDAVADVSLAANGKPEPPALPVADVSTGPDSGAVLYRSTVLYSGTVPENGEDEFPLGRDDNE